MTSNDLNFVLKIVPDTAEAEKKIGALGRYADKPIKIMPDVAGSRTTPYGNMTGYSVTGGQGGQSAFGGQLDKPMKVVIVSDLTKLHQEQERAFTAAGGGIAGLERSSGFASKLGGALVGGAAGGIAGGMMFGPVGAALGATGGAVAGGVVGGAAEERTSGVLGTVGGVVGRMAQGAVDKSGSIVGGGLNLAAKGLDVLSGALNRFQEPLGPIGDYLDTAKVAIMSVTGLLEKLPIVGKAFGTIGDAAAGVIEPLRNVLTSLVQMTAKSNPGVFNLWQKSLDNVQATIGSRFIPVLEQMIKWVDKFGDTLASILPNAAEIQEDMKPLIDALDAIIASKSEFNREMGPLIREGFRTVIRGLSSGISILVDVTMRATKAIGGFVSSMLEMVGLGGLFGGGGAKGQGGERTRDFAARPASFQGLGEYEQSFQAAAFGSGGTVANMKPEEFTSPLAGILDKLGILADAALATWPSIVKGFEDFMGVLKAAWEGSKVFYDIVKPPLIKFFSNPTGELLGIVGEIGAQFEDKLKSLPAEIARMILIGIEGHMIAWGASLGKEIADAIKPWNR